MGFFLGGLGNKEMGDVKGTDASLPVPRKVCTCMPAPMLVPPLPAGYSNSDSKGRPRLD